MPTALISCWSYMGQHTSTKVSFIYKCQYFFSMKQSFSTRVLGVKFVTWPLGSTSLVVQLITKGLGEDTIRNQQEAFCIFPILAFPSPLPSQNSVPKGTAPHGEGG